MRLRDTTASFVYITRYKPRPGNKPRVPGFSISQPGCRTPTRSFYLVSGRSDVAWQRIRFVKSADGEKFAAFNALGRAGPEAHVRGTS